MYQVLVLESCAGHALDDIADSGFSNDGDCVVKPVCCTGGDHVSCTLTLLEMV